MPPRRALHYVAMSSNQQCRVGPGTSVLWVGLQRTIVGCMLLLARTAHADTLTLQQPPARQQYAAHADVYARDRAMAQDMDVARVLAHPELVFELPQTETVAHGHWQLQTGYTFSRGNFLSRIYDNNQRLGHRSQHRKTHLSFWKLKYGLTDRWQPEVEALYKAYRQHTHSDGDEHDRNDDGGFERLFVGMSYQAIEESAVAPALRLRGGWLAPTRGDTEGIGQETGFEVLAAMGKQLGNMRLLASAGFAMTFDNVSQLADPDFDTTQRSKGHDLRTLSYGLGMIQPLTDRLQMNFEVAATTFDHIELNERRHRTNITATPGLVYKVVDGQRVESWWGLGFPVGLNTDTDHIGVSFRTTTRF
jgi:hypothetical protein